VGQIHNPSKSVQLFTPSQVVFSFFLKRIDIPKYMDFEISLFYQKKQRLSFKESHCLLLPIKSYCTAQISG
jgi:hypothetical protein